MKFTNIIYRSISKIYRSIIFSPLLVLFTYCGSRYDHKLKTPDRYGSGYNLTPFGCLVYGPWQTYLDGNNEAVYLNGKEISSVGTDYSALQQDFVFQLLQDGTVKYWFKSNYDSSLTVPTEPDTKGILSASNDPPADKAIGKVFKSGTWKANFQDSTLIINFGKDSLGIPPLKGKYKDLGSAYLEFQQISFLDSNYNGRMEKLKKIITTHYNHPWINDF